MLDVATVLTVYGIETPEKGTTDEKVQVATVLTVYGIETLIDRVHRMLLNRMLQQYLPFTVLKPANILNNVIIQLFPLQQYLPFTVLKQLILLRLMYDIN